MQHQTIPTTPVLTTKQRAHRIAVVFFGLLSAVVLYFSWQIIAPYATPIILAVMIATFTFPLYKRLVQKLRGREATAAGLMCLLVTLVIIVPFTALTLLFIQQAVEVLKQASPEQVAPVLNALHIERVEGWIRAVAPGVAVEDFDIKGAILSSATIVPGKIADLGGMIVTKTVDFLLGFVLMMLTLFYFYVDGRKIVENMKYLSPLPDAYDQELIGKFRSIVNATLKGSFMIGIAQGVAVGIGMAIVGINGAAFWGAVTVLASFLPMIGSALIWVPAVIYLAVAASLGIGGAMMWHAIFLGIWGVLVVSLLDNFLRPYLMTTDVKIPAIVLFFSILGGLQVFGFLGILLGPLVFALLATLAHIYRHFFRDILRQQNTAEAYPDTAKPAEIA